MGSIVEYWRPIVRWEELYEVSDQGRVRTKATGKIRIGTLGTLGPDEEFVTISQLAYLIAELLEFDQPFEFMPDRPREVVLANCSAAKARSLLDYQTKWTLEDGLKEMIDWIREQGPKPFDYKLPLEIINEYTPTAWSKRLL